MEIDKRDFKGIWIPREIWLDDRLSALDKIILLEIDSLDCDDEGCYASNDYLASFCQCSITKVSLGIKKLITIGYIYTASFNGRTRVLKSRLSKSERQTFKNCKADFQKVKANNINDYNNIINKENNISKDIFKESKKQKKKYGTYGMILLTDDEYNKLIKDFGKRYVEAMLEKLDEYVGMNNNKNGYKNFNLVMRKALKEEWFKLKKSDFDRISDDTLKKNVKYFETLYITDIDKYDSELQFLDEDERKEIIKQVEYGGFDNI